MGIFILLEAILILKVGEFLGTIRMETRGLQVAYTGLFLLPVAQEKSVLLPDSLLHLLPFSSILSTLFTCPSASPATHNCSLCVWLQNHLPPSKLVPFLLVLKRISSKSSALEGVCTPKTQLLFLNRFFIICHFNPSTCQGFPRTVLVEEYESLSPG